MRRPILLAVGLVLLVLAIAIMVIYTTDIRAARERLATGSLLADTPCGIIEYAEAGEGPAVLVVHGAGGGFDQGMGLGKELVDRGFRVVSVSRFGYLGTPMPEDGLGRSPGGCSRLFT